MIRTHFLKRIGLRSSVCSAELTGLTIWLDRREL